MPASSQPNSNYYSAACWGLLAFLIFRLWLSPLSSSFWVDEMVTAFVVNHPGHPSFAIAPQVPESLYYWLPRVFTGWLGASETAYRIPSVLSMAFALWLIGLTAKRLVHPDAAWLAVFGCFCLRWFNYFAVDARPYALGICVAVASLLCLVRWLDNRHRGYACGFLIFGSLLWRIHLIYWPFYALLTIYALSRLIARTTPVPATKVTGVFAVLGLLLVPVALKALAILHEAGAHVITELPGLSAFQHELRWSLVLGLGTGAWLVRRLVKPAPATPPAAPGLLAGLWLTQAVCLFAFSHITGNSAFIDRYLSLGLPGTALAAAGAAAFFLPAQWWRPAALATAFVAVAISAGASPRHDHSDWRGAALAANQLAPNPAIPVICPSPFVEARTPVWNPDYPLPGFLYSHLPFYTLKGKVYLLPFESADGIAYAGSLTTRLAAAGKFLVYGSDARVKYWRDWYAPRPELKNWRIQTREFGDVWLAVFSAPGTSLAAAASAHPAP